MPKTINTYIGGMNKDLSKSKFKNTFYYDLLNGRVITDEGLSTGSIENVRGNTLNFNIPSTSSVWQIEVNDFAAYSSFQLQIDLGIIPAIVLTISGPFSSNSQLVGAIVDAINSDATLTTYNIKAGVQGETLLIYSDSPSIFYFSVADVTPLVAPDPPTTVVEIVEPIFQPRPIGSTIIREDIYIFTTADESTDGGAGQIWKLTYNKETYASNITLLYNNQLNFTTQHPIMDEAVGIYENSLIQKIFWTDDFNPLRVLNVADPNIFFLSPDLVSIIPTTTTDVPILQEIVQDGGSVLSGQHMFAYKLSKLGTGDTVYSIPSNPINVLKDSETEDYTSYAGETSKNETTTKQLKYKIENIDTSYDTIEVVNILNTPGSGYKITKILSEPLSLTADDNSFEFTYTGEEDLGDLLPEEYFTFNVFYTQVGSIAVKDSRLLLARLKEEVFALDYNTRSYRYNKAGGGYIIDGNDINPYNKDSTRNAKTDDQYKWKDGEIVLGGSGTNIDYNFVIKEFDLDDSGATTTTNPTNFPFVSINKALSPQTINDYTYNMGNLWNGYKNPYFQSAFTGYQRSEVYRFGIVFFDKSGRRSNVKWIGDIRMPDHYDTDSINSSYDTSEVITVGGDKKLVGKALGLNFEIKNISPSIKSKISGFSIVRANRNITDRTIIGQGIINPIIGGGTFDYWNKGIAPSAIAGASEDRLLTFDSIQNKFIGIDLSLNNYTNLSLRPVKGLGNAYDGTGLQTIPFEGRYFKHYEEVLSFNDNTLNNINYYKLDFDNYKAYNGGEVDLINFPLPSPYATGTFHNKGYNDGILPDIKLNADSCTTMLIETESNITDTYNQGGFNWNDNAYKLVCNIYKELVSQYGGDTEVERENTSYVFTGHYQRVEENDGITDYSAEVWGGDTFITIADETKFKNTSLLSDENINLAYLFPIETTINSEIRLSENPTSADIHFLKSKFTQLPSYKDSPAYSSQRIFETLTAATEAGIFTSLKEFDNLIQASEVKINGERNESWGIYKSNNVIYVDGNYGKISKIDVLNDQILFWQDSAFGVVAVNPRSVITDTTGTQLELGTGDVLQDFNYYSNSIGSKHQFGIIKSRNSAYWIDINTKKFYKFSQGIEPVSDIKGLSAYLNDNLKGDVITQDNPIYESGITGVYDPRFSEIIFTIKDVIGENTNQYSFVYSEFMNAITGFYSFTPNIYISDGSNYFSPEPAPVNTSPIGIYLHNKGNYGEFYGTIYPTELTYISNPEPNIIKTYTNLEFLAESKNSLDADVFDDTITSIRFFNDYQDTGTLAVTPDLFKRKLRVWRHKIKRSTIEAGKKPRMRDYNIFGVLTYDNTSGNRFILHDLITSFLLSQN